MNNLKRKTKGTPDLVDKHVGKQLRSRRSLMGLSQEKLAEAVGVTFQQVQKYERGTNRISASRLYTFSKILDVSIDFFYNGMQDSIPAAQGMSDNDQEAFNASGSTSNPPENVMSNKETIDLLKSYYSIEDDKKRKELLNLVKSMAKNLS